MKKSKLIIGTLVLSVAALIVGKATKKYSAPVKLYITDVYSCIPLASSISIVAGRMTTSYFSSSDACYIRTVYGGLHKLFAATVAGSCTRPIRCNL